MTEGLLYISVRIYREDSNGEALIKGSGTLFEDNGFYYVLTAYHCIEDDKAGIAVDLNLTKIAIRLNKKDYPVDIIGMVDKNKDSDWALLSVNKPSIDWSYEGKVKLTTQINIDTIYESYPYVTAFNGVGRYTRVIPLNDEGYCHISDDVTSGRLHADTVMNGGSGAGIVINDAGVLYCFGFMKETLPQGQLNDFRAVCVDDIIPLLSSGAVRDFTEQELSLLKEEKRKEQSSVLAQNLTATKNKQELLDIVKPLLESTIPALLNNLQDEMAKELLDVIEEHCQELFVENPRLHAQYYYCKGLYYRLLFDAQNTKETYKKAYELNTADEKLIAIEAARLWKEKAYKEALALTKKLSEDNEIKIALSVVSNEDPEAAFHNLSQALRDKKSLRFRISDMIGGENGMPLWLMQGAELEEPETLSLKNLADWMYFFTCIHYQVQGFIPLSLDNLKLDNVFSKAYYGSKKYFSLAKDTKIEHAIPILEALYCYWSFLVEKQDKWIERLSTVDLSKESIDKQIYGQVLHSSILTLKKQYDNAFQNIFKHKEWPVNNLIVQFVIALCCVSKQIHYFITLIEDRKDSFGMDWGVDAAFTALAQVFPPTEFAELMKRSHLSDVVRYRLYSDFNKLFFHEHYSIDFYTVERIATLHEEAAAVAATLLFHGGEKEKAINYLKDKVNQGEHNVCEETYYQLIAQDNLHRPEYFEYLQTQRKNGAEVTENQLREEFNFSLMLQDFDNALDVIRIIWDRNPADEWAIANYFALSGRKGKVAVKKLISLVLDFPFTKANLVQNVYFALTSNGFLEEATQFLYSNTIKLQSEGLSAFYDQQAIMGPIVGIVNRQYQEVIDGSYVLYTTDGSDRLCRKVTGGTVLGDSLIGHQKDDELSIVLSGEEKHIKILGIFNKYYYLHFKSMKEVMENGGNAYFTPFRIDTSNSGDAQKQLVEFLEKMSGEDERLEAIEKYKRGELGLIHFVDDSDIFLSYYDLLFTDFPRLSIPYGNYIVKNPLLFIDSCEYVLDITAMLLLFEFSMLNSEWKPRKKFLLPKFIRELVLVQQKTLPMDVGAGLHKAMKRGKLHRFSDDYGKNLVERFEAMEKWIDSHCTIVASSEILKIDQPIDSQKGRLLSYTLIELLNNNPNKLRVLLSEDYYYQNMCENLLPLISTESYMYKKEGEHWGKKFSEFLQSLR